MTFVVFLAALVLVRLGLWQVARYQERQQFNRHYIEQSAAEPLIIDQDPGLDLSIMEYRKARVTGLPINELSLVTLNQYHDSKLGYALFTPLQLKDGSIIYINRGWIPSDGNGDPKQWAKYAMIGEVSVEGIVRKSANSTLPVIPGFWMDFDSKKIQLGTDHHVINAFIQLVPKDPSHEPPIPNIMPVEITDGPHAGYALQWFTFAILLLGGYPFFLRTNHKKRTEEIS